MNKGGQPAPRISTGSGSEEAQQGVWGRVAPGNGALPGRRPSSLLLCRFSGGECLSRCEWLVCRHRRLEEPLGRGLLARQAGTRQEPPRGATWAGFLKPNSLGFSKSNFHKNCASSGMNDLKATGLAIGPSAGTPALSRPRPRMAAGLTTTGRADRSGDRRDLFPHGETQGSPETTRHRGGGGDAADAGPAGLTRWWGGGGGGASGGSARLP